jgi:hypothetical protein
MRHWTVQSPSASIVCAPSPAAHGSQVRRTARWWCNSRQRRSAMYTAAKHVAVGGGSRNSEQRGFSFLRGVMARHWSTALDP